MIDLSGIGIYAQFVIGLSLAMVYFYMLSDGVYQKIAASRYWAIGWIGALLIFAASASLLMPFIDAILTGVGLSAKDDDAIIPYMIGGVFILVIVCYARTMWMLRAMRRKSDAEAEEALRRYRNDRSSNRRLDREADRKPLIRAD